MDDEINPKILLPLSQITRELKELSDVIAEVVSSKRLHDGEVTDWIEQLEAIKKNLKKIEKEIT